jgi:hypothetical protein
MRVRFLAGIALLCLSVQLGRSQQNVAAPNVTLAVDSMGPREIEDLTRQKIVRDYSAAWKTLALALEHNRADLLNDYFAGSAKAEFVQAISEQKSTGIHRRYEDRGHKVDGLFYSPDGGVMQLRDTAQYDLQIFDGTRLIHDQPTTVTYIVLMTPAADRWMVRLLQAAPSP